VDVRWDLQGCYPLVLFSFQIHDVVVDKARLAELRADDCQGRFWIVIRRTGRVEMKSVRVGWMSAPV